MLWEILKRVSQWYIAMQSDWADLLLFNYTPLCQYEKARDEYTMQCRWLILSTDGYVVARPFDKFFNLEELEDFPKWEFFLQDKMDWSLGIVYYWERERHVATRWSFKSDQAKKGKELLNRSKLRLNTEYTHLFEIIYPENRIVVNYGNEERLVYLTSRQISNGSYTRMDILPSAKIYGAYDIKSIKDMQSLDAKNQEGFVAYDKNWCPQFKIKFETYVRLHKLMTNCTEVTIWEWMRDGIELEGVLWLVPDEFYDRVREVRDRLLQEYNEILHVCIDDYNTAIMLPSRKEQAMWIKDHSKYPWIVFALLDRKKISPFIYKAITPWKKKFLPHFE